MNTRIERFKKVVGAPVDSVHIFIVISFTADGISGELKVGWDVFTKWVDERLGFWHDIDYQYVFDNMGGIFFEGMHLKFYNHVIDKLNENN
jgi:hypothetical protein